MPKNIIQQIFDNPVTYDSVDELHFSVFDGVIKDKYCTYATVDMKSGTVTTYDDKHQIDKKYKVNLTLEEIEIGEEEAPCKLS